MKGVKSLIRTEPEVSGVYIIVVYKNMWIRETTFLLSEGGRSHFQPFKQRNCPGVLLRAAARGHCRTLQGSAQRRAAPYRGCTLQRKRTKEAHSNSDLQSEHVCISAEKHPTESWRPPKFSSTSCLWDKRSEVK